MRPALKVLSMNGGNISKLESINTNYNSVLTILRIIVLGISHLVIPSVMLQLRFLEAILHFSEFILYYSILWFYWFH